MPRPVAGRLALAGIALAVAASLLAARAAGPGADPLRVRVTLSTAAAAGIADLGLTVPLTGRLYVILSRDGSVEPRFQTDVSGVPFWGMDVASVGAGDAMVLDTSTAEGATAIDGFPLARLADIPAGDYWLQPVLNVYTRFERADGHTVFMHLNAGEGQQPMVAPGNAIGTPQRLRIDPDAGGTIELTLDAVIPPIEPVPAGGSLQQGNPRDGELTKFVKIRSRVLSEFWGRDMYIGANVLLPRDWAARPQEERYATLYMQGHFPGRSAPFGYGSARRRGGEFTEFWNSARAPRLVAISIRDANPFYDTSYGVDSANVGPYGTAITQELIPFLEERFRLIPEGWARLTAGGSTGGWEAIATQVLYPELFGGAWGWCPDPVDFRYYQIVNVYDDDNAYFLDDEWHRVERPNTRRTDGNVTTTVRQENLYELAMGRRGRGAGQWAIWEAVFSPVAPDGYAMPIWDPRGGAINAEVASYWRQHWDLRDILQRDWARLAPFLRGKLHVAVGDMDTYYLEQAVYLLQESLESMQPPADASFQYGRRKPHCWIGASSERPGEDLGYPEFVRQLADYLDARAPAGAARTWR